MSETLTIFGIDYPNTEGFKVKDDLGTTHTYAEGGGSQSNDFIITLSYNSTSEMWEPDCTFTEISAAYSAEKNIAVIVDDNQDGSVSPTYYIDVDGSGDLSAVTYFITVHSYDEQTEEDIQTVLGYFQNSDSYIFTFEMFYYYPYDADAVAADVAGGKTFYTSTGRAEGSAPMRTGYDLYTTDNGRTVNIPAGFYENALYYGVGFGTAGTPTATKGTVSNHAVAVTPSVTNTTGWITGSTINGTAVSVSASELVSGTLTISSSGTKDVTNYASASVSAGTEGTPTATKGTVSNHSISVTPSVTNTAGYIAGGTKAGTAVSVSASELDSGTKSITSNGTGIDVVGYASVDVSVSTPSPTLQNKTATPTESVQTITPDTGYDGLSSVEVGAISSTYVGSGITQRTSQDIDAGQVAGEYRVSVPSGYYQSSATVYVPGGSVTALATKGTVSNHSISITPSATKTAGYVQSGSVNGTAVSVSASELVSGSETKTANGTYDVTNLASLVVAVPIVTYYTGSSAPSSSLGSNGDIYLQTS